MRKGGRETSVVSRAVAGALLVAAAAAVVVPAGGSPPPSVVSTSVHAVKDARGVMVTSGGWAYCLQAQSIARRTRHTLVCGTYAKDGYRGPGLRELRHLDWGNHEYLSQFAQEIRAVHRRIGGDLVLIGASYAGFGVAALASRHPELRPRRLIVVDAYFDLVARRRHISPGHMTAREIDGETGGAEAALRARSVSVAGLARLVRRRTRLTVVWTISEREQRLFGGATCDRTASAATLARLASTLGRPVFGWVTRGRHGVNFWRHGRRIARGRPPGKKVVFEPGRGIPAGAVCE